MLEFFFNSYKDKAVLDIFIEIIVFFFGIMSVIYAKKENILVFPVGLIATVLTVYLLYKVGYFADMTVNIYYSIMSVYGWINWSKKKGDVPEYQISRATKKQKWLGLLMFTITIFVMYGIYKLFDQPILQENYIDIFTTGIFFTGMWFMALKKIENWTLWIIGNLISIPLYGYRGLGILSLQFIIFTILAIMAYREWNAIIQQQTQNIKSTHE